MQRESYCKHCKKIFYYEDGVDEGLTGSSDSITIVPKGYCPVCTDPHFIPGESYRKDVIFNLFKQHLKAHQIAVSVIEDEDLLAMMKTFPSTWNLYSSNGSYTTVTLTIGTRFHGLNGQFEIGQVIRQHQNTTNENGMFFHYMRELKCLRCSKVVIYPRNQILHYYMQLKLKACKKCDASSSDHKRNTSGLNRTGSIKSEFSERALAKALNVSRNDYRRYHFSEPVPALPPGTVVSNLIIQEAYWDEDPSVYAPMYLLFCPKCKKNFTCLQKRVDLQQHFC